MKTNQLEVGKIYWQHQLKFNFPKQVRLVKIEKKEFLGLPEIMCLTETIKGKKRSSCTERFLFRNELSATKFLKKNSEKIFRQDDREAKERKKNGELTNKDLKRREKLVKRLEEIDKRILILSTLK